MTARYVHKVLGPGPEPAPSQAGDFLHVGLTTDGIEDIFERAAGLLERASVIAENAAEEPGDVHDALAYIKFMSVETREMLAVETEPYMREGLEVILAVMEAIGSYLSKKL